MPADGSQVAKPGWADLAGAMAELQMTVLVAKVVAIAVLRDGQVREVAEWTTLVPYNSGACSAAVEMRAGRVGKASAA